MKTKAVIAIMLAAALLAATRGTRRMGVSAREHCEQMAARCPGMSARPRQESAAPPAGTT